MSIKTPLTLVQELIKLKILTEENADSLERASIEEDKDFGQVLVDRNLISAPNLLNIKSQLYHIPSISLEGLELDKDALKEISEDVVNFYNDHGLCCRIFLLLQHSR